MNSSPFGPRLLKRASAAALIAASFTLAGAAQADVVKNFTWTIDGATATGTLTVADTPTIDSFRLITGLTGVMNGEAMTLVPPGIFPPGAATNDNLIDIDASELTYNGLSWMAGDRWWNIYWDPITRYAACNGPAQSTGCDTFVGVDTFVLSDPPSAVPTPATLPLVAIGGLALLASNRRRRGC